jgi:protein-disulfide isomerase
MMKLNTLMSLGVLLGAGLGSSAPPALAQARSSPARDTVATLGGQAITSAQLARQVGNKLFGVQTEEYNQKLEILENMIAERLLTQEAERRKLTRQQLEQREVEAKVSPVTEAEKKSTYEQVKARVQGRPEAEVLKDIERDLTQQRRQARHTQFVGELKAKAGVRILLDPPRLKVAVDPASAKGPSSAAVTIIEFSDFECPYCSRAAATIRQLQQAYVKDMRIVFRHYPLPFHQNARKAAEAAECAREQGKFWEMHDKLFETQKNLTLPDLKKRAVELGLNAQTFAQCLDSGRHAARVGKDASDGESYGVKATPTFFINGRLISGALPYEQFAQIIDFEIAQAKR